MSGLLEEIGTPCPSRFSSSRLESSRTGSDAFNSLWEDSLTNCDDTINVEFTTQIKPPTLTGAKPRRKTKADTGFAIHDEVEEKPVQATMKRRRETNSSLATTNRKKSLLAQPAQRFRPKVSFAPSPTSKTSRQQVDPEIRRSVKVHAEENKELLMQINGTKPDIKPKDVLKKDVRRNTVYIPPDDTTVASVFMGIFSPLKSNTYNYQVAEDTQVNTLESQIAKKRLAKKSLAASAQRVPLQPSSRVEQESSIRSDVMGKNGGKENIPPGSLTNGGKVKPSQPMKIESDDIKPTPKPADTKPRITKPLVAKNVNGSLQRAIRECQHNATIRSTRANGGKNTATKSVGPVNYPASSSSLRASASRSSDHLKSGAAPSQPTISRKSTRVFEEYPIIPENITNPAIYEDNWLSHQEVVLTQLLNDLFHQTDGSSSFYDPTLLRHELLSISQDAAFAHLYKRVQASLLYGAMSIPKDILCRNKRLRQDVGMRRKFLDFWLQTYDLRALRAAIETITGRIIPDTGAQDDVLSESADNDLNRDRMLKRKLEPFLDRFLLQNHDMDLSVRGHDDKDTDTAGQAYRRTVLRCIMTIILLDKGQTCSTTTIPRLFAQSSQFKSSAAVLKGLARLLLPSCGDIIKALAHLDCQLVYEQLPLQEYTFSLSNLAVDLRDGVRLTKVVELLMYADNASQGPLSRRLKLPCLSRAVKIFNVQIALDALASTPDSKKLIRHVRAMDIVDGHREKTIALLWGLVSRSGLSGLVDWDDVRKEIDRLKLKAIGQLGYEQVKNEGWLSGKGVDALGNEEHEPMTLLTQWASILARLKGLHLENLSTSFGDGKIYESIVDEYESYIVGTEPKHSSSTGRQSVSSLQTRLRALGCSAQFTNLVAPSAYRSHILDSDFTVGALAFLCSRLLSATKRARAASILQRTWRRIMDRRATRLREMARDVAIQCAAVVQTRERVMWAKGVILQWWRASKVKRQRRKIRVGSRHGPSKIAVRRAPLRGQLHRY